MPSPPPKKKDAPAEKAVILSPAVWDTPAPAKMELRNGETAVDSLKKQLAVIGNAESQSADRISALSNIMTLANEYASSISHSEWAEAFKAIAPHIRHFNSLIRLHASDACTRILERTCLATDSRIREAAKEFGPDAAMMMSQLLKNGDAVKAENAREALWVAVREHKEYIELFRQLAREGADAFVKEPAAAAILYIEQRRLEN